MSALATRPWQAVLLGALASAFETTTNVVFMGLAIQAANAPNANIAADPLRASGGDGSGGGGGGSGGGDGFTGGGNAVFAWVGLPIALLHASRSVCNAAAPVLGAWLYLTGGLRWIAAVHVALLVLTTVRLVLVVLSVLFVGSWCSKGVDCCWWCSGCFPRTGIG
jgi:hypothetical protein